MGTMMRMIKTTIVLAKRPRCKSKTNSTYFMSLSNKQLYRYIVEAILDHNADFLDVSLRDPPQQSNHWILLRLTNILG